jgi:FkbM family methyltransferase
MNLVAKFAAFVQNVLRRLGYELHPYPAPVVLEPEDRRRARLIASRAITLLLDVGANTGQFAEKVRATDYRGRIVSFEPLAGAYAQLSERSASDEAWQARRTALGEENGSVDMNVAGNLTSSSLLPMGLRHLESAPQSEYVGTETVATARLESIWEELARPDDRVWLKLDVQGYELHVLRGAESVLDRIDVVQAEMALQHLYEGDSSWRELVAWLEERGFRLAGLEPGFEDPQSGELLQADGIFVRGVSMPRPD